MTIYLKERSAERRNALIWLAGGRCKHCGAEEDLQFDHIDKRSKEFNLSGNCLNKAWNKVYTEFLKCQLLCSPCHAKKTNIERGHASTWKHGTLTGYRYCKCQRCKTAKSKYNKKYKPRKAKELAKHGTYARYKIEVRAGKGTCYKCRTANSRYTSQLKTKHTDEVQ